MIHFRLVLASLLSLWITLLFSKAIAADLDLIIDEDLSLVVRRETNIGDLRIVMAAKGELTLRPSTGGKLISTSASAPSFDTLSTIVIVQPENLEVGSYDLVCWSGLQARDANGYGRPAVRFDGELNERLTSEVVYLPTRIVLMIRRVGKDDASPLVIWPVGDSIGTRPKIVDVEVICNNGFEHWMTTLENGFNPLLDKARAGDLSFFDDDPNSRCRLIYYFFVQMLRTKVYDKMVDASCWNKYPNLQKMLRHGTAFEVAYSNASDWKNFELRLIVNKSSLSFITGDQPLVNLDANDDSPHFDLYFPISPTQAMVFIEKGRFQSVYSWLEHITEREAHELNRQIAKVCIDTVCAESKSVLDIGRYK